ncbi:MAG: hypothetical protein KatS3mg114_1070 [Planctomycetaceae bacterium]|nr:MAG: hypothetical protein KatS3mg114_1070 [Planctomycetaceae bacterium]
MPPQVTTDPSRWTDLSVEDRDWLMYQYVRGELSASDAEAVEVCLATDVNWCQCLTETVQLLSILQTTPTVPLQVAPNLQPGRLTQASTSVYSWLNLATLAACLLVCLSSVWFVNQKLTTQRMASSPISPWTIGTHGLPEISWEQDDIELREGDNRLEVLPAWMMAAISLEQQHRSVTPSSENLWDDESWEDN